MKFTPLKSLISHLIQAIEDRRFPDAMNIIGLLKQFTSVKQFYVHRLSNLTKVTSAAETTEKLNSQLAAERAQNLAQRVEIDQVKLENQKLKVN